MYLGGVISGPEDGVISDRNLRTRWQNEFRLLLGCCGGASRSDSNPPQQPQTLYVCGASARVRSSLYSRTWLEAAASPAGAKVDFVSRRGSKTASRNGRPALYFYPKKPKDDAPKGGSSPIPPLRRPSKNMKLFAMCTLTPQKHESLAIRNSSNTIKH